MPTRDSSPIQRHIQNESEGIVKYLPCKAQQKQKRRKTQGSNTESKKTVKQNL